MAILAQVTPMIDDSIPFDPREQRVVSLDDRERRLAKLELLTIVDEIGVDGARALLPKLGMVEHFGLPTVTLWLDHIAQDSRR
jgi:hypothetical protein